MIIIGHRGARGLTPENTLASLAKALEFGVDCIEFDLRVTKDGVVILNHDDYLHTEAGDKPKIAQNTYKKLKSLKPNLISFDEALDFINQKTDLYIEVKPGVDIKPIATIIEARVAKGWKTDRLALGSFSQQTLQELHQAMPEIKMIVIEKWSGVRARLRARQVRTKTIAMNQLWLWSGFIKIMRHGGYELYAYTLNNPTKVKKWAKHGLAGVVTDYPDRFKN